MDYESAPTGVHVLYPWSNACMLPPSPYPINYIMCHTTKAHVPAHTFFLSLIQPKIHFPCW